MELILKTFVVYLIGYACWLLYTVLAWRYINRKFKVPQYIKRRMVKIYFYHAYVTGIHWPINVYRVVRNHNAKT